MNFFFLVDDIYVLLVIRVNLFDIKGMIIVSLLVLCYVWIIRAHASYSNLMIKSSIFFIYSFLVHPFLTVNRRLDEWVKLEQLDLDSVETVVDEKVEDKVISLFLYILPLVSRVFSVSSL